MYEQVFGLAASAPANPMPRTSSATTKTVARLTSTVPAKSPACCLDGPFDVDEFGHLAEVQAQVGAAGMTGGELPREPIDVAGYGVAFRQWHAGDVEAIVRIQNDPDVSRFVAGPPSPYLEDDAERRIALAGLPARAGDRDPVILTEHSAEPVGALLLDFTDPPEVGYIVAPSSRNRGYATAALRAVTDWLFAEVGVGRVELVTHPENVASQRVATKVGFEPAGEVADYAEWPDGNRRGIRFALAAPSRT